MRFFPFSWPRYLRNTLRACLQIWHKCPLGVKDGQRSLWPKKNVFVRNLRIHTHTHTWPYCTLGSDTELVTLWCPPWNCADWRDLLCWLKMVVRHLCFAIWSFFMFYQNQPYWRVNTYKAFDWLLFLSRSSHTNKLTAVVHQELIGFADINFQVIRTVTWLVLGGVQLLY